MALYSSTEDTTGYFIMGKVGDKFVFLTRGFKDFFLSMYGSCLSFNKHNFI